MERMNEILARAASRRITTRRAPTPAPSATASAKAASAGASPSPLSPLSLPSSSPRHIAPRRSTMGQASQPNGKSAATIPPRRLPARRRRQPADDASSRRAGERPHSGATRAPGDRNRQVRLDGVSRRASPRDDLTPRDRADLCRPAWATACGAGRIIGDQRIKSSQRIELSQPA